MRSTRLSFFWLRHIWGSYSLQKRELGHNFGVISRTSRLVNHNLRQIWLVPNKNVKTQTWFSSLRLLFFGCIQCYNTSRSQEKLPISTGWPNFLKHRQNPLQRWVPCIILLHHIHDLVVLSVSFGANHESDTHHFKMKIAHTHTYGTVVLHPLRWKGNSFFRCLRFFLKGFGRWPGNFPGFRVSIFAISQVKSIVARSDKPPSLGSAPPAEYNGCSHPVLWLRGLWSHNFSPMASYGPVRLPRIIVPVVFSGTQDYMRYSIDLW